MENYISVNKKHWDEVSKIHEFAPKGYYDLQNFFQTKSSLKSIELDLLGDIRNKRVLHLMCHFGIDTLSMAQLGARVTGVDFSEESIRIANSFKEKSQIDANFICSNVYDLNRVLNEKFDIVIASYGVFCWLDNLEQFMKIIKSFLVEDGVCYLIDGHPMSLIMQRNDGKMFINKSYYCERFEFAAGVSYDYADESRVVENESIEFYYKISDIVNAICESGMKLENMTEYPYCDYNYHDDMIQTDDGWWAFNDDVKVPLTVSFSARNK